MPAPDLSGMIKKNVEDLKRLQQRDLPVKVGKAITASIKKNFREGSFYNEERWSDPLRKKLGFRGADGSYGPLLSRNDHLMDSTNYVPLPGRVIIRNPVHYASVHNDGDQIAVTERMKNFFWGKHRDAKKLYGKGSPEADFWRNMALKKPGSRIKIPRRRFMAKNAVVLKMTDDIINAELRKFIKEHFNGKITARSH